MTGFGKAADDITGKTISVEIRSLNSKQLDLSLKIRQFFEAKKVNCETFALS